MRHASAALLGFLPFTVPAQADFLGYREHLFQPISPSADNESQAGFDNPAVPGTLSGSALEIAAPLTERGRAGTPRFGLFARLGGLGFGMVQHRTTGKKPMNDYRLSLGFGSGALAFGLGTGWTSHPFVERKDHWKAAALWRPSRFLSLSATRTATYSDSASEWVAEFGVRPLGTKTLTLFADWSEGRDGNPDTWSAGSLVQIGGWANLFARYAWNDKAATISAGVGIGAGTEARVQGGRTEVEGGSSQDLPWVASARFRSRPDDASPAFRPVYARLTLRQSPLDRPPTGLDRLFSDGETLTLRELLASLEEVRTSPTFKGVVVEIRRPLNDPEKAWEIRRKLLDLKKSGKRVVAHLESTSMNEYLIASAADRIVVAPYTEFELVGFARARTYAKGTLEKLGVGVQEFRFLKYKSAAETFSRSSMSEGEKEQSQRMVESFLESWTAEVSASRPALAGKMNDILNSPHLTGPEVAKELGIVDAIGTREEVKEIISGLDGRKPVLRDMPRPGGQRKDDRWGPRDRVALVYAVGSCAMDSGLQARRLAKEIDDLSSSVKALVLRVDSPGGDALAADVVNQALGRFRAKHGASVPIIVSQGRYAASGGYWLALDSDVIFSSPFTLTGSIGVIGAWFYDDGASKKLGLEPDVVKAGKYSDRAAGVAFPLLGEFLPQRKLLKEEEEGMVASMKRLYGDFVDKVARFRKKSRESIEKAAEGRVWTGPDALKAGLVDRLGGLEDALEEALKRTGLERDAVDVVEASSNDFWDEEEWESLTKSKGAARTVVRDLIPEPLRFRMARNGQPLATLPLEFTPESEPASMRDER